METCALGLAAAKLKKELPIFDRIAVLNLDEQLVLEEVLDFALQGLEKGRTSYGPMDLSTDTRDLEHEAREELRDGQIYLAADRLKKSKQHRIITILNKLSSH